MIFITDEIKRDPQRRWDLPDEVFFAAGACHILAYAFLQKYKGLGFKPQWIKPGNNHRGNHVFVTDDRIAFDYTGFNLLDPFLTAVEEKMVSTFYGWTYDLVTISEEILVSQDESKKIGMWLREPKQFLHDALPRAEKYLEKFELPN